VDLSMLYSGWIANAQVCLDALADLCWGVLGLPPQLKLGVIGGSHVGGLVFQTERSGMEEEEGAPHLISLRVGWAPLLHPRADVAEGFWYKRFHRFVYVPPNPVSPVLARVKTRQVVIQKSTVKHILGTTFGTEHQLNNGCNSWKWHLQFISDMLKSIKQTWLIWEYNNKKKNISHVSVARRGVMRQNKP
jgi:hypothetical protein